MEIVKENYHPSFFKGENVKSVFEFELPEDQELHYNALNGHKYRELLTILKTDLEETIKQAQGSDEANYLSKVLSHIDVLAVNLDVKVNRK